MKCRSCLGFSVLIQVDPEDTQKEMQVPCPDCKRGISMDFEDTEILWFDEEAA